MEGFLRYKFGGLIHGRAYFSNFMVFKNSWWKICLTSLLCILIPE